MKNIDKTILIRVVINRIKDLASRLFLTSSTLIIIAKVILINIGAINIRAIYQAIIFSSP